MNHVVQYTFLEQWLERPPIHDITGTVEEFVDIELQSGIFKNSNRLVLVELHQHIDIAFRAIFASCHRSEYCGVRHSKPPQLGLMGAKGLQYVVEVESHYPGRVYQTVAARRRYAGTKLLAGIA